MTENTVTENAATELRMRLEALLIVTEEPVSVMGLATALSAPVGKVRRVLDELVADYNGEPVNGAPGVQRGFELRETGGGFRLYVRETFDDLVSDFVHRETPAKLSQAALETLAVIAYRQPISRGAIASIRAVNVDSVVRTLVNRGLIEEAGHDEETGAVLWGTTDELLEHLGIGSIDELPPIAPLLDDGQEEYEEAVGA